MIDIDYTDDLVLLFPQHNQAVALASNVNVSKQSSCSFRRSHSRGKPLKLIDQLTYFGSNVSSTESNVNIRVAKALAAFGRLSILWKSDLSYKIRRDFF